MILMIQRSMFSVVVTSAHALVVVVVIVVLIHSLAEPKSSAEERSSNTKRTKREREILQFRFISRTRHACTQRLTFADVTFFLFQKSSLSLAHAQSES